MSLLKRIIAAIQALAVWLRDFFSVAHLCRFSLWISVIGSGALFATSESMEVLRVIVEDQKHRIRGPLLFALAALFFGLMSWYWARVLIYLLEPQLLKHPSALPFWQRIRRAFANPRRLAALWIPRLCGIIPFVGIAYSLYHAAHPQGHVDQSGDTRAKLMVLFYLTIASGAIFLLFLTLRRPLARYLRARFPKLWPQAIKTTGPVAIADLPRMTRVVIALALLFSLALFITFYTTTGQVRTAGWLGPAPLLLFTAGVWIALGSVFVVYLGRLLRLPILTPLLILALIFSYFDLNDNHKIRDYADKRRELGAQPLRRVPIDFREQFNRWLEGRKDRDEFKGQPYPVFIVTAEGGGITTAYYTAQVLGALQDRNPAFAQHVFAISGVSGGSVGTAVYAGLNAKCQPNQETSLPDPGPWKETAGPWQTSADRILRDDYLSPLLAAFLYPDLVQRFLPFPVNSWDRARALEDRLETSWRTEATCKEGESPNGSDELSQPYYDFWHDFDNGAVPAVYFNTTSVERGERMIVTRMTSNDQLFDNFQTLAQMSETVDPPFSTAACLSARFPVITPAGYILAGGHKYRYVDGGYYENSGTDTANDILSALRMAQTTYDPPIMPVIIRIGFPLPAPRKAREAEENRALPQSSEERNKYKGQGLNEILSPVRTLLNTRGARGADSVRQIQNAIDELNWTGPKMDAAQAVVAVTQSAVADASSQQAASIIAFEIDESKVALPLGWLLSDRSRCDMQQQLGSLITQDGCGPGNDTTARVNREKMQRILALLTKAR